MSHTGRTAIAKLIRSPLGNSEEQAQDTDNLKGGYWRGPGVVGAGWAAGVAHNGGIRTAVSVGTAAAASGQQPRRRDSGGGDSERATAASGWRPPHWDATTAAAREQERTQGENKIKD
ncbi:hypothetical protein BGW80DRAFT_1252263 [Lactifluus volemus]|nr:hypothetical protein BGW80DRAFT_1252263 [Lactifluus volemus]